MCFVTYRNQLVRVVHHCNEKIEQYDNTYDRITAKHQHPPKSGETFNSSQFKVIQVN